MDGKRNIRELSYLDQGREGVKVTKAHSLDWVLCPISDTTTTCRLEER